MSNLQVKDIDENLYRALKIRAKNKRRSVSQEVIRLIEDYLTRPDDSNIDDTRQFLSLSWEGENEESAKELIAVIRKNRRDSRRFKGQKDVFN